MSFCHLICIYFGVRIATFYIKTHFNPWINSLYIHTTKVYPPHGTETWNKTWIYYCKAHIRFIACEKWIIFKRTKVSFIYSVQFYTRQNLRAISHHTFIYRHTKHRKFSSNGFFGLLVCHPFTSNRIYTTKSNFETFRLVADRAQLFRNSFSALIASITHTCTEFLRLIGNVKNMFDCKINLIYFLPRFITFLFATFTE